MMMMVPPEAAPPVRLGPGPPRPVPRRPPGSLPYSPAPPPPTRPRSDDGSTPTQLLPAPCSVSSRPEDTGPSSSLSRSASQDGTKLTWAMRWRL